MYLQGDLQMVFDALYHMGIITPLLEKDWGNALEMRPAHYQQYSQIVEVANSYQEDMQMLMEKLKRFDEETLGYLAMEVAREYADFHTRESIH